MSAISNLPDEIAEFFSHYERFTYNSREDFRKELWWLWCVYRWPADSVEWNMAQEAFNTATVNDFDARFGTMVNDPEAWCRLCGTAGIIPIPPSLVGRRSIHQPSSCISLFNFLPWRGVCANICHFGKACWSSYLGAFFLVCGCLELARRME